MHYVLEYKNIIHTYTHAFLLQSANELNIFRNYCNNITIGYRMTSYTCYVSEASFRNNAQIVQFMILFCSMKTISIANNVLDETFRTLPWQLRTKWNTIT